MDIQPVKNAPPEFRQPISARKLRSLQLLGQHVQRLADVFGIRVSPKGQDVMVKRILRTGKNRVYRKRPMIFDPTTGYRWTYGDRRKINLEASQRQGVEFADALRKRREERGAAHLVLEPKA